MIIKGRLNKGELVPPVEQIAREMTESSQVMIIVKRALKLGPAQIIRLGLNNIVYLPKLAKKDFATGVKLLCELTILATPERKRWVLHPQMTDMAIALKNYALIKYFFELAKKYEFEPGLVTNNPEALIMMLADVGVIPSDLVVYARVEAGSRFGEYIKGAPIKFRGLRS